MTETATAKEAFDSIKARIGATFDGIPCFYQNENNELPDTPAAFAFVSFETHSQVIAGYGGGRGQNRWRTPGLLEIFVFVPTGQGLSVALDYAETFAALFRGQRFDGISCEGAQVDPNAAKPSPLKDIAGNYYAASALIDLYFDQIG